MSTIEYRVRPVSRYIVTRYESTEDAAGVSTIGEFPNRQLAVDVANAFAGTHGIVTSNILPEHDVPALLRNIAEDAGRAKRGIVCLIDDDGATTVYGLGAKVGDPAEILRAAQKELAEIAANKP